MVYFDATFSSCKMTNAQKPSLHLFPRCFKFWMWYCRSVKNDNHFSPLGRNISHQYASCSCVHFQHIIRGVTFLVARTPPPSIKRLLYFAHPCWEFAFVFIHIQCTGKLLVLLRYDAFFHVSLPSEGKQTNGTTWLPSTVLWSRRTAAGKLSLWTVLMMWVLWFFFFVFFSTLGLKASGRAWLWNLEEVFFFSNTTTIIVYAESFSSLHFPLAPTRAFQQASGVIVSCSGTLFQRAESSIKDCGIQPFTSCFIQDQWATAPRPPDSSKLLQAFCVLHSL